MKSTRQTDWIDGFCSGVCLVVGSIAVLGFVLYILPYIVE